MVLLKSLSPPSEGIRLQTDTAAVLDGKRLGSGTLFVAEARLSWFDGSGLGFSLEYPTISLHAISRDLAAFPEEHLYVMVNAKLDDEGEPEMQDEGPEDAGDDDDDDDESEDSGTITEIRFVPGDKAALEPMFSAMCDCQALHPDPEDADTDDDDDEGEEYDVEEAEQEQGQGDVPSFYTCEEGLSHLTSEGQATLDRLEECWPNQSLSSTTWLESEQTSFLLNLKMEWRSTHIQSLDSLMMLMWNTDGLCLYTADYSTSVRHAGILADLLSPPLKALIQPLLYTLSVSPLLKHCAVLQHCQRFIPATEISH